MSPDLDEYLELPEDAILHREQLDGHNSVLGGTAVWVKRDAQLLHTRITSQTTETIEGSFLAGGFTGALLSEALIRASIGGGGGNISYPQTLNRICEFYTVCAACFPFSRYVRGEVIFR
jgi:hypothetical protein